MTDDLAWLQAAGTAQVLAEIHATVDLERTLVAWGFGPELAATAIEDVLLGARVVLVNDGSAAIAVAEPSTEGRLAATLARHDEGLVGRYVQVPRSLSIVRGLAAAAGVGISRPGAGPFGTEILILGPAVTGPHIVLVDPRRVPSPG